MAEWLKAHAWKACIRATVSWVRIPLPPPRGLFAIVRHRPALTQKSPPILDNSPWILRYTLNGKTRDLGLGSAKAIPLKRARELAQAARTLRAEGIDPIEHRKAKRLEASLEDARALTFKSAATQFIAAHRAGWRNAKHAAQWESTLATYAYPIFGNLSVGAIDTTLVLAAIEPIWKQKPETASRVRGRIEAILDWATARKYRTKSGRSSTTPRCPTTRSPRLWRRCASATASLPGASKFVILTAARTSEVIGARWGEIDLDQATWAIPPERMKAARPHRVPLSGPALDILHALRRDPPPWGTHRPTREQSSPFGPAEPVFARAGKPLSNMALLKMLALAGHADLTVHGFRSTFRTWAAERTAFPREVVEAALAHVVGSKVEAAYQRGDLFDKRRGLMDAWADFCAATPATVIPLRA